jgi:hypothetical protein
MWTSLSPAWLRRNPAIGRRRFIASQTMDEFRLAAKLAGLSCPPSQFAACSVGRYTTSKVWQNSENATRCSSNGFHLGRPLPKFPGCCSQWRSPPNPRAEPIPDPVARAACSAPTGCCLTDDCPIRHLCVAKCTCQFASPMIVDTSGEGFHLTSAEEGVFCDIAGMAGLFISLGRHLTRATLF